MRPDVRGAVAAALCAGVVAAPAGLAGSGDSVPYGAQVGRVVIATFDAPHAEQQAVYTLAVSDGPRPGEVGVVGSICASKCVAIRRVVPGSLSVEPGAASLTVTLHEIGRPIELRGPREPGEPSWGSCWSSRGPRYESIGADSSRVRWVSGDRAVVPLPLCGSAATAAVVVFS